MPFYTSNRAALDRAKPLEVVLELNSFAGGENTIGSDHELKSNESRRMENWEVTSLGGMERSAGFDLLASGVPIVEDAVFDGDGLDDCTSSGTIQWTEYAIASGTMNFDVELCDATTASTADLFKWNKDDGAWASGITIQTASGYHMSDGVDVTFAAASGHTLSDLWEIKATAYRNQPDLIMQAEASGSQAVYGVIEGDLVIQDDDELTQEDAAAFTDGELCHGISVNDQCFITNSTDNLKAKVMDGSLCTPLSQPTTACDRIYYHKFRLIAEGGGKTVYGSRLQPGYWYASDAWTATNDAWNMTLPDETQGMAIGFPTGDDVVVFTERQAFQLSNFPDVAHKVIPGLIGCSAPYSIAIGAEGVYYVSKFPKKAVILWNGVNWQDLTVSHDFVDDINFDQRIFGIYKNRRYYLLYASEASEATYPDQIKVYDAVFGRWYTRVLNANINDTFGYPTILGFTDNELYIGSSQNENLYELDGEYTDDNDEKTEAVLETKNFSSKDFSVASGGGFPIDRVRIKLTKVSLLVYGSEGVVTILWNADRGRNTGSQTFDLTVAGEEGDLLNTEFTVNTSKVIAIPDIPDRAIIKSFPNKAIGRDFSFQINNLNTGIKPIVRKIKIHGITYEEI